MVIILNTLYSDIATLKVIKGKTNKCTSSTSFFSFIRTCLFHWLSHSTTIRVLDIIEYNRLQNNASVQHTILQFVMQFQNHGVFFVKTIKCYVKMSSNTMYKKRYVIKLNVI